MSHSRKVAVDETSINNTLSVSELFLILITAGSKSGNLTLV